MIHCQAKPDRVRKIHDAYCRIERGKRSEKRVRVEEVKIGVVKHNQEVKSEREMQSSPSQSKKGSFV